MKQVFRYFYSTIALLLTPCLLSAQSNMNKHALIVGISNYASNTGWDNLHTANDVQAVSEALLAQGFSKDKMQIVTDQDATKNGIRDAFNALGGKVAKGDIVHFHFSGHGQQIADADGDEVDNLDEALVPYDAPIWYKRGEYEGQKHISDDELNAMLNMLRSALGKEGHLLVTIDACHSGTATRGLSKVRGTEKVLAPNDFKTTDNKTASSSQSFLAQKQSKDMAEMVALFASMPYQLNNEVQHENGKWFGSLSYAFSKALMKMNAGSSYAYLFDQIKVEMGKYNLNQSPDHEGDLSQHIYGNELTPIPEYYKVEKQADQLLLNAGLLMGLTNGSEIGLFPPDSKNIDELEPIAKGSIVEIFNTHAILELEEAIADDVLQNSWAFVTSKNFGGLATSLKIDIEDKAKRDALQSQLLENNLISFDSEQAQLYLLEESERYVLINAQDALLEKIPKSYTSEKIARLIIRRAAKYAQAAYLRNIEMKDSAVDLALTFELISDKNTSEEGNKMSNNLHFDKNNVLHFRAGDQFRMHVKNNGKKYAFFSIIDIQPDNFVNVLVPRNEDSSADFKVFPGQTMQTPIFKVGPPLGNEVLLLVASDQPLDLRKIFDTRGGDVDNAKAPFEVLFAQSYYNPDLESRGISTVNVPIKSTNINHYPFVID